MATRKKVAKKGRKAPPFSKWPTFVEAISKRSKDGRSRSGWRQIPETLGKHGRDTVTGFAGVVVSITSYIDGFQTIGLQQRAGLDSRQPPVHYVATGRFELL